MVRRIKHFQTRHICMCLCMDEDMDIGYALALCVDW